MSTIAGYYTSDPELGAPNPRVAAMFAAEKGINLAAVTIVVDLPNLDNRSAEQIAVNPTGALPYVQLTDGSYVGESIAICELIEEQPGGVLFLFGTTASERAATRMWQRRVEHLICLPIISGLRWGPAKDFFAKRTPHNLMASDAAAEGQFETARHSVAWLDKTMVAAGSPDFICGSRYTVADLQLFVFVDWALQETGPCPDLLSSNSALAWVPAWYKRVHSRPAAATTDPARAAKV
jgi:glutathione S-transferase